MTRLDGLPYSTDAASTGLLSIVEVAKLCHCSPRHIRRLVDTGQVPAPVRLGSLVRWNRGQILKWIEGGCPVPDSEVTHAP